MRAWQARAAEASAAAALVSSAGTSGLSPDAATSVARALASLRDGADGLAAAVARHAGALAETVDDLEATDEEVAAVVDRLAPVLPAAGGW
ncbi:hypothetical protein [Nocardioides perillae]|uniref:Uncharacterized protein n=1 Tax=Nocardioides perillae TaxID=1119534 RepID=A0A7Y9RXH2_9ACTN|nr:hypothetical protein [Nocardioides perillae]NYG56507.1 hypothetical protein [Nocardioides perillae]